MKTDTTIHELWEHSPNEADDVQRGNPGSGQAEHDGETPGGDWLEDEMASLRRAGTDVLVCMLTLSELRELDLTEEAAAAEAAGVRFIWVPTPDRGTPELQRFRSLVAELIAELAGGHHVVVHCRMGIGRSSLVAAGVLGLKACRQWMLGPRSATPEGWRCRTLPSKGAGSKPPQRLADRHPMRFKCPRMPDPAPRLHHNGVASAV